MIDLATFVADHRALLALCLLAGLFLAFVLERQPPEVSAVGAAALFVAFGLVAPGEVLDVFSNPAPITIAALFVLSGALVRTGVLAAISHAVIALAETRPRVALAGLLAIALVASGFVNNTPVVLVLIPVILRLARSLGTTATRLLIPLSYVAILGGTCTLIGTSTNLLVDGVARGEGIAGFSIFEITPVGIVVALVGLATLAVLGPWLLPDRAGRDPESLLGETSFISQVVLRTDAQDGRTIGEIAALGREGLRVTGIQRGDETMRSGLEDVPLQQGDRLILLATTSELLTLHDDEDFRVGLRRGSESEGETVRAEVVVTPQKSVTGKTLSQMSLGRRFGIRVLGAHRHGHIPGPDLENVRLRPADKLLLDGPAGAFEALEEETRIVSVSRPTGRAYRRGRAPVALATLAAVIGLAALGFGEIAVLALLGVAAILVLNCVDAEEAWETVDGSILVLIFSMLIVGRGLQNSGAVELVVAMVEPLIGVLPAFVALYLVYLLASALTEAVTNNAVAVVFTPVAIGLAEPIGLDPRALVVAVMFGASASFATPIGYQTNTLVYGAGDYRFADFVRIGLPMNLITGLAACAAIWVLYR